MTALLRALWLTITNPPDEDGERFSRRSIMWDLTRPMWTYTALTTLADCGCRRRFGVWHVTYCARHGFDDFVEVERPEEVRE